MSFQNANDALAALLASQNVNVASLFAQQQPQQQQQQPQQQQPQQPQQQQQAQPNFAALGLNLSDVGIANNPSTISTPPPVAQSPVSNNMDSNSYQSQTAALLTALLRQQQEEDRKKQALLNQLQSALSNPPVAQNNPANDLALLLQQQKQAALPTPQQNNSSNNHNNGSVNPFSFLSAGVPPPQVPSGAPPSNNNNNNNMFGASNPGGQLDAVAIAKLLQAQQQPQGPAPSHTSFQAPARTVLSQGIPSQVGGLQANSVLNTATVSSNNTSNTSTGASAALAAQLVGSSSSNNNNNNNNNNNATTALLDSAAALSLPADRRRKGRTGTFPQKLHQMLSDLERQEGGTDIASFLPHGRAFAIHKPRDFVKHVMPKYFRMSRFSSFQRQLNLYDFQRITEGGDKGSYYHELFVQGRPILSTMMKRNKIKGVKNLKQQQQQGVDKDIVGDAEEVIDAAVPIHEDGLEDEDVEE